MVLAFAFLAANAVLLRTAMAAQATDVNRPVSKVIELLKDMDAQLQKEGEQDQAVYDKMACWCETNEKEKTKAIADAKSHIADLTTTIEELTAMSVRLAAEIKVSEKEVAENQAALDKATEIRQKQLAEFNDEEKDLVESISALKAALVVLGKHNSFVQLSSTHKLAVTSTLRRVMKKQTNVLTSSQTGMLAAFLGAPQDYFDAEPTFKQSYAPASGEIFGILTQMKETFEANIVASQKEEAQQQKAYEELKAAKEAEIAAGQAAIDDKTQELASTDEKLAMSKQDLEDTKSSLNADEEFLTMLKEKCQMTDKEWEERTKTRKQEMEAVSKALAILSGDEAHDIFTSTFNPAFLQKEASANSNRRAAASKMLASAAAKLHSPRLSMLATQVRLDAFTKVKAAIDELIAQLLKDKEDEIKKRDFCISEFNQNQLQTEEKEREKADLIAKIEDLDMTIKSLTEAIEKLQLEIEEMQVQLKRAGEDRDKENKEFRLTVADQRETQKLLAAALSVLEGFYGKQAELALLQKQEPAGPPPPPGFEEYKKSGASGDVMAMIAQIIADAKAMEAETIRADAESQTAYEAFVAETDASIAAKNKDIDSKTEDKAKAESDLIETKETKESVLLELEQLSNYNAQLHLDCDFTMKNFDVRQAARDEEVEALRQAKAILSGSDFKAFLQGAR